MNTISAISSKNTLRCHRRISETQLKFCNILIIFRSKNHIIKGNALLKNRLALPLFLCFSIKILLSFIDHTPVGQSHHSGRKDHWRDHARADRRSHHGVWHFYREYACQYPRGAGVKCESIRLLSCSEAVCFYNMYKI